MSCDEFTRLLERLARRASRVATCTGIADMQVGDEGEPQAALNRYPVCSRVQARTFARSSDDATFSDSFCICSSTCHTDTPHRQRDKKA